MKSYSFIFDDTCNLMIFDCSGIVTNIAPYYKIKLTIKANNSRHINLEALQLMIRCSIDFIHNTLEYVKKVNVYAFKIKI